MTSEAESLLKRLVIAIDADQEEEREEVLEVARRFLGFEIDPDYVIDYDARVEDIADEGDW